MKSNTYLYGEDVEVPEIPHSVIDERIELLNKHLTELLDVGLYKRDGKRCNGVINAIDFWTKINKKEI